jgi:hypothetical protein
MNDSDIGRPCPMIDGQSADDRIINGLVFAGAVLGKTIHTYIQLTLYP